MGDLTFWKILDFLKVAKSRKDFWFASHLHKKIKKVTVKKIHFFGQFGELGSKSNYFQDLAIFTSTFLIYWFNFLLISGTLTETQNKALKILLNKVADLFESNNVGIQINNLGSPPNCSHFDTKWNFYNSLFFSFTAITTIGKHIFQVSIIFYMWISVKGSYSSIN